MRLRMQGEIMINHNKIRYDDSFAFMAFGRWRARTPDGTIYTTNGMGQGLFIHKSNGDVRQLLGTGQFMPRTFAQFKGKFYRWHKASIEGDSNE